MKASDQFPRSPWPVPSGWFPGTALVYVCCSGAAVKSASCTPPGVWAWTLSSTVTSLSAAPDAIRGSLPPPALGVPLPGCSFAGPSSSPGTSLYRVPPSPSSAFHPSPIDFSHSQGHLSRCLTLTTIYELMTPNFTTPAQIYMQLPI